jgi:hypothetical protein
MWDAQSGPLNLPSSWPIGMIIKMKRIRGREGEDGARRYQVAWCDGTADQTWYYASELDGRARPGGWIRSRRACS